MSRYVKYIGTSHVRQMTRTEWATIPGDPVDQDTLVWNAANGWTISADRITDAAWPYIKADGEFIVVDSDLRAKPSEDDPDTVDVKAYPPLMTAQMAEDMDQAEITANEQLDNVSGSVTLPESVPGQSRTE